MKISTRLVALSVLLTVVSVGGCPSIRMPNILPGNYAPTANAGPDQTVDVGDEVTLNGAGSLDPDEDTLTFTWTRTQGPSTTLTNADQQVANFVAQEPGDYIFELTVSDGSATDSDTVTIFVREEPAHECDRVLWSGNGHEYCVVAVPGGISWEEAKAAAESAGGHLATVTSDAENEFLKSLIPAGSPYWWLPDLPGNTAWIGPWLGGYQTPGSAEPAAGWRWVTNELWFPLWCDGEPTNGGGSPSEGGLEFFGSPSSPCWNDRAGDGVYPFGTVLPHAYIVEFD